MARIYKANGEQIEVSPKGKRFGLQELQSIVGGYVEVIDLKDGTTMVVNEEGRLKKLPVNDQATDIYSAVYGPTNMPILGDVLVCKSLQI